jgi:hypothetical protein
MMRLFSQSTPLRQGSGAAPLSDELLQLIASLLRRNPDNRPADAGELLPLLKLLPEAGPAASGQPTAEAPSDSSDHYHSVETPQMGVAVLNELLHKLKDRAYQSSPEWPARRRARPARIAIVALVIVALGVLGWLVLAQRGLSLAQVAALLRSDRGEVPHTAPAAVPAAPPPAPPRPVDLAAHGAPVDLAVADQSVVDLSTVPDAGPSDLADPRAIKVRLVYTEDDEITSIECTAEAMQHVSDKHGRGIEAILRPGESCRASSPRGSRVYKYDALAQRRVDPSGVRRVHVRIGDSGGGEAAPSKGRGVEEKPDSRVPPSPEHESGGS